MRHLLGAITDRGYSMMGLGIGLGVGEFAIGSSFSPTKISGLNLWLDASDSATLYQSNGGSLAASDGDPVGYWLDKSGQSRHATQATGVNKATVRLNVKNGRSVIRFAGSQWYTLPATYSPTNISVFWAFNRSSAGIKSVGVGMLSSFIYPFNWYTDNVTYGAFTGGAGPTLKTADTSTGYFILNSGKTGTGASTYTAKRNGTQIHSASVTGGLTMDTIGRANADSNNGDFLELLVYNSELSAPNEARVLTYLNNKWGIY